MVREIFFGMGMMYSISVICMVLVIIAMAVDLVSGWRKAKQRGEERTSYLFSRTLTKFLIYEGILLISCCIDTLIHFAWIQFSAESVYLIPLATILLACVLCSVEAWSVREKAEEKTRHRIDKALALIVDAIGKDKAVEIINDLIKKQGKEDNG